MGRKGVWRRWWCRCNGTAWEVAARLGKGRARVGWVAGPPSGNTMSSPFQAAAERYHHGVRPGAGGCRYTKYIMWSVGKKGARGHAMFHNAVVHVNACRPHDNRHRLYRLAGGRYRKKCREYTKVADVVVTPQRSTRTIHGRITVTLQVMEYHTARSRLP